MANWICIDEKVTATSYYYFTKKFDASKNSTFTARACGDTRYQLYLNGNFVCEGPCQGSQYETLYETADLTKYLVDGENVLAAKVLFAVDGELIAAYHKTSPSFYFEGTLTPEGGEAVHIGTDGTWEAYHEDACTTYYCGRVHISVAPFECWTGASDPRPVPVRSMYWPNIANLCCTDFGAAEKYIMSERKIPQMYISEMKKMTLVQAKDNFFDYDNGCYTTAKVRYTFKAKKGTKIKFIYSECYSYNDGTRTEKKKVRDDHTYEGARIDGVYDTVIATGKVQTFEPFWYRAFRFVRIEVIGEDAGFTLKSIEYADYKYPLDITGQFTASDKRFDRIWEVSKNTLLCCMHEIYCDCPYYEQQQYQMDSALEMMYTFHLSRDKRMPFKALCDLAASQLPNGMLQANYPSSDVQIIPNFSLFWVLLFRDYIRYAEATDDEWATMHKLIGVMDRVLAAFEVKRLDSGLVGVLPYWNFVDWVPGWYIGIPNGYKTEPLTVTSLMYAAALRAASEICDHFGRYGLSREYSDRADDISYSAKKYCFDKKIGMFKNTPVRDEYSQHTTLWAVLSETVTGDEAKELIDRTFNSDVEVSRCTFSMSYYMFRAIDKAGCYDKYAKELFAGWEKMLDLHCTTWCETPDDPRSECHGWSAAPIYEFSAKVLGVTPTDNSYMSIEIKPSPNAYDLDNASGAVPTPYGDVLVKWEKKGNNLVLEVTIPEALCGSATVVLPSGKSYTQYMEHEYYISSAK